MALAVADVNWFTTENLFREFDRQSVSLLALKCMDYRNGWRRGIYPWSAACRLRRWGANAWARELVLPSGWMKTFPRLGMRPIARTIRRWWTRSGSRAVRGLVMTYPHYLFLRDQLRPDVSVYYNLDDYSLYWPDHADSVRALEYQAVLRSDATICVSRFRAEQLRASVPEAAGKIHHIPHGTPASFLSAIPHARPAALPPDLAHLPRPLLGYVGSIEDRVDWKLLAKVSEVFPQTSIVVVGRAPSAVSHEWFHDWTSFLARPNVHQIGWRTQDELPRYYQSFDAILIPYAMDHPFNRACCPTKIMDGMGSGRPIVATAIPECQLYSDLIHVADDHPSYLSAVRSIVEGGSDDGRAAARHAYAQANSCRHVANRILAAIVGD